MSKMKDISAVNFPDIIENRRCKRKVLGRLNNLVFLSQPYEFDIPDYIPIIVGELKRCGFRIVQEEDA